MRVLLLLALLGTALAVPKKVQRIVGGTPTTIDRFPYMANMQYGLFGVWWFQSCGGSLLNQQLVLSAAHCFLGDLASSWRVVLGTSYASTGGSTHAVSRFVLHPMYNTPVLDNDLALVFLSTPTVFSSNIQAARIPSASYVLNDDEPVTSIGWGDLWFNGPAPEQLQYVDMNVINQDVCAERYAWLKTQPGYAGWPDISDGMLCVGALDVGGKDACQGDSGGPLAHHNDIVVGVVSWGFECADSYFPGVNARTSYYSDWIVANSV